MTLLSLSTDERWKSAKRILDQTIRPCSRRCNFTPPCSARKAEKRKRIKWKRRRRLAESPTSKNGSAPRTGAGRTHLSLSRQLTVALLLRHEEILPNKNNLV